MILKRRRILIVNCHFDEIRLPVRRKLRIPQSMTPAYLAGLFSPRLCDIQLYDEIYSGPLEDESLLSFPHMVVLTGLNTAFDRMRHITAYVRTKVPQAVVVAGGPAIRAIPRHAGDFFDYCCTGDIEELADVIRDAFGEPYVSETFRESGWVVPRYDLTYWMKLLSYVESSRNCYFRCNYCSLTAEKAAYRTYSVGYLRRQFTALGPRRFVHFLDNNFASHDNAFVSDRFDLLAELKQQGAFHKWTAEVTSDFFMKENNLERAVQTGCGALFCGVESFEHSALVNFRKHQNTVLPQVATIRRCLEAGIAFHYGLVFDMTTRTIAEIEEELSFILGTPEISLPAYVTLAIPMLGSPYFHNCLKRGLFFPNTRLRDMDGATLYLRTRDPLPEAVRFVRDSQSLKGYRRRAMLHAARFYARYRKVLCGMNMTSNLFDSLLLCAPTLSTLCDPDTMLKIYSHTATRTFIGPTEALDSVYRPVFRVASRFRNYFEPTMITDPDGCLVPELHDDLGQPQVPETPLAAAGGGGSRQ
jgi:hypothetical protein